MKFLARLWRKLFGPNLKSLAKEVSEIINLIKSNDKNDSVITDMISDFLSKADIYAQDNPANAEIITGYKTQLAGMTFQEERFTVLESAEPLRNILVNSSRAMNISLDNPQKLAFLLAHGAELPKDNVIQSKDHLVQVMITWEKTNKTDANFKPFLKHVYQGKLDMACNVFSTALETGALKDKMVDILTGMKKAVIKYLFPLDQMPLTSSRLDTMFNKKGFKPFYHLLNTPTSDLGKGYDTKTITKLEEANNDSDHAAKSQIIQNLLKAQTLDVITPASSPIIAPVAEPVGKPPSTVGKFLSFIGLNNNASGSAKPVECRTSSDSRHSSVNDAESTAYDEFMNKPTVFGRMGDLTL